MQIICVKHLLHTLLSRSQGIIVFALKQFAEYGLKTLLAQSDEISVYALDLQANSTEYGLKT
jgi:hypothetical protein